MHSLSPRPRSSEVTGRSRLDFNQRPVITDCATLYRLAAAQEREAERQYRALSAVFRAQGDGLRAALFRRLADFEAEHLDQVQSWAKDAVPTAAPETAFLWDDLLVEGAPRNAHDLSAPQALAHCIHNEERAYALYRDIAAATPNRDVRLHAEKLAEEELDHLLTLRQEDRWLRPKSLPPLRDVAVDEKNWQAIILSTETDCGRRHRAAAVAMRRWGLAEFADLFQDLSEEAEAALRAQGHAVVFAGSGQVEAPSPEYLVTAEATNMLRVFDSLQHGCHLAANDALAGRARNDTARAVARLARIHDASARHLGLKTAGSA